MNLYHVPILIGGYYQDSVTCDVVGMDACHILLGRPRQHNVHAINESKKKIFMCSLGRVKELS